MSYRVRAGGPEGAPSLFGCQVGAVFVRSRSQERDRSTKARHGPLRHVAADMSAGQSCRFLSTGRT